MKVKLENISKTYFSLRGKVKALSEINLEIRDREFLVILGPSGCGKTTLLNLIAGIEKPSSGEIYFGEKLVFSDKKNIFVSPKERNIAMVFQNYALYPHMSVFENIAFPLRIQKMDKNIIKKEVEKVAEMLNIKGLLQARPYELSGGEKQRVAIARALVRKPNLFLLDEPLSNLDAQLRLTARTELKTLQKNLKITTIYVTHDQIEAMSLGERIVVMNKGKIEQIGTPEEVYHKPENLFVAKFIGTTPINYFVVEVKSEQSNIYGYLGELKIEVPEEKLHLVKDQKIGIGIRPEDIKIEVEKEDFILTVEVNIIESLGKEYLLHTTYKNYDIKILTKNKFSEKNLIKAGFSKENLYFFSPE
ncbi:MAG: ABC-type sugar transport system [Thermodesulfobacterium sp.]|uniref:ABC-type sugar transport system n=1 Tax=Candidatus Thermodesulfobacterium syntrophicum TaxID=3060442 RepID=A0AAE3P2A3_9BACT|nr:ABC-type sugar transport system [Candidatus Thermodesulfobacterium syntrophicum]